MALSSAVTEVLHRIRVKLYPNYLPQVEGVYIARTNNEASLTIEQVCAALKNRGGFTGNYDDLVEHVKQFLDEVVYQICDGFAVNLKTAYPSSYCSLLIAHYSLIKVFSGRFCREDKNYF